MTRQPGCLPTIIPDQSAVGLVQVSDASGNLSWQQPTSTTDIAPTGLTGATAASRYVGATVSGAPATGTFAVGDFVIDQTGAVWICTAAGTPGTWVSPGATAQAAARLNSLAAAQSGGLTGLGYVGAMASPASGVVPAAPTTRWTSGALWGQLLFVLPGVTVNGVVTLAPWGGGALAGTFVGLYNSSGTQLGITADLSATSTNGRGIRAAVTGFTATPADGKIYMLYTNGTLANNAGPYALNDEAFNFGYPVQGTTVSVMGFSQAGPTTMPASLTFGSNGIPSGFSALSPQFFQAFLD